MALLRETPTVLLALVRVHQSGVVTAFHQDEDLRAMNAAVQGTRGDGAVAPRAIQYGLAVPAPRPRHVRVPERVLVPHPIRHTRGTVEAGPGLSPLVGEEGATAGMISEIVGPGLQRSLFNFLVSNYSCMQNYIEVLVSILPCATFQLQLLAVDESSARIGLTRRFIIVKASINDSLPILGIIPDGIGHPLFIQLLLSKAWTPRNAQYHR